MGMVLIYGLVFLVIFSTIAIGLFVYSKKKKWTFGLIVSVIMISIVVIVLLTNTIDEHSITKKDVLSDLKHINIELIDDFEIKKNKVTGMPERIQETEIQITKEEKDRIINKIIKSKNFKSSLSNNKTKKITAERSNTTDKICNYKFQEFYSREIYTKIDNIQTRLFLSIYNKSNTIKYKRIEE